MLLEQGDCLDLMWMIPDKSVDMILCDLPYGTTSCTWDSVIDLQSMWEHYRRVAKPTAAIVLTAAQPFTTTLISSNLDWFRYCWYWNKNKVTGFANAKKQPLRCVEDVVVFYSKPPIYKPQGLTRIDKVKRNGVTVGGDTLRGDTAASAGKGSLRTAGAEYVQEFTGYPRQVLEINSATATIHPTQKPVELMEYFIHTYTNPGDTVLDNCMGSGSTGVACMNTGREFIGFEEDSVHFKNAESRVWLAWAEENARGRLTA